MAKKKSSEQRWAADKETCRLLVLILEIFSFLRSIVDFVFEICFVILSFWHSIVVEPFMLTSSLLKKSYPWLVVGCKGEVRPYSIERSKSALNTWVHTIKHAAKERQNKNQNIDLMMKRGDSRRRRLTRPSSCNKKREGGADMGTARDQATIEPCDGFSLDHCCDSKTSAGLRVLLSITVMVIASTGEP